MGLVVSWLLRCIPTCLSLPLHTECLLAGFMNISLCCYRLRGGGVVLVVDYFLVSVTVGDGGGVSGSHLFRSATLCTWWTGLYYYHLKVDVIMGSR